MRRVLARAAAIVVTLLVTGWAVFNIVLSFIGKTTVVDDFNLAVERLPALLQWLYQTPWYVPTVFSAILILFLVWLAWPERSDRPASTNKLDGLWLMISSVKGKIETFLQEDRGGELPIVAEVEALIVKLDRLKLSHPGFSAATSNEFCVQWYRYLIHIEPLIREGELREARRVAAMVLPLVTKPAAVKA